MADREIDRCSMQGEKEVEWEEAVGRKRLKHIHELNGTN